MKIFHVPCLEDNYAYMIIDETTNEAAVVDPVEPEKIIQAAKERGVKLKSVLTTHHHWWEKWESFLRFSSGEERCQKGYRVGMEGSERDIVRQIWVSALVLPGRVIFRSKEV